MIEGQSPRSPRASRVEMTQLLLPSDANALGTAFGGRIMQWIDIAAAVAARRHAGCVAVTVSIDSVHFDQPVHLGYIVVVRAAVNRGWRSSMEVGVRVEAESDGGGRRHAVRAYLTFVALDAQGRPRAVPALLPETDEERRRFAAAEERRTARLAARRPRTPLAS